MKFTVLIVDDDKDLLTYYKALLEKGYNVLTANSGEKAIELLGKNNVHIVLTDFKMPGISGIDLARKIKAINSNIVVILMTSYGTIEVAVKSMKNGADDFIEKPIDKNILKLLIENYVAKIQFENAPADSKFYSKNAIIGISDHIEEVHNMINTVAKIHTDILITGETGTGKELVANQIIEKSKRNDKPVARINCAAIKKELMESELFGHEKGAFTGANKTKMGYFETLDGGTLFMDEIGELDIAMQSKLLRIIENREFIRVGGTRPIRTNVRLLFATNKDIKELVHQQLFRQDLYYRINKINIDLLPLRERREDIPVLVRYFTDRYCHKHNIGFKQFSPGALRFMKSAKWGGNVRELKNCIEKTILLSDSYVINRETLTRISNTDKKETCNDTSLDSQISFNEKVYIQEQLENNNYNITKTAEVLQINRTTLYRKIKKYGIDG